MVATKLLTITQFARLTGLSDFLARKLVGSGEVPSVKVGPRRRVDARTVDAWLGQGTYSAASGGSTQSR